MIQKSRNNYFNLAIIKNVKRVLCNQNDSTDDKAAYFLQLSWSGKMDRIVHQFTIDDKKKQAYCLKTGQK